MVRALASGARRALLGGAAATAILPFVGCKGEPGKPSFRNTDVTGAAFGQDFALVDHTGRPRRLADFAGKVVVVFFGFTQCPDVCPTTLAEMAEVRRALGADGERVQVIFVTLDPERDTPALLAQYVPAFDASFLGLRGSPEETAATARAFKVFFQKVPGRTPGSYTIDHTAGSYVFDTRGRLRLFVKHHPPGSGKTGNDALLHDLRLLLAGA